MVLSVSVGKIKQIPPIKQIHSISPPPIMPIMPMLCPIFSRQAPARFFDNNLQALKNRGDRSAKARSPRCILSGNESDSYFFYACAASDDVDTCGQRVDSLPGGGFEDADAVECVDIDGISGCGDVGYGGVSGHGIAEGYLGGEVVATCKGKVHETGVIAFGGLERRGVDTRNLALGNIAGEGDTSFCNFAFCEATLYWRRHRLDVGSIGRPGG